MIMKKISLLIVMVLCVFAVNAQTRTAVKIADLPKAITDNITAQHPGYRALDAFKVDNKGVMSYEVLVKKADSEMNLIYDKDGKFIKMEPKKMAINTPAKKEPPKKTPAKK
jgi:hypothetical protein